MAAMIPDEKKEEVRGAADIVEVVEDYVKLKRSGRSWKGLCPFHDERTASFHVTPSLGIYKCFGCGASGDV
ncbi:MAG TPA: CHC2 zinc finger domain-containing protein, partial [Fodinibius sp.]|nr:CHC2 zinc finger domain-containing protein [Fodinibius sp.]